MKVISLTLSIALMMACNGRNPQQEAQKDSAQAVKESDDFADKSTVSFVTDAANGNLEEIELGNLAQKNGNYTRVKDYAARMVTAHTAAMEKLKAASRASGVAVPSSSCDTGKIASFANKKGFEFDEDYVKEMVSAHQKMSDLLDVARTKVKDTTLQRFAKEMYPEVKAHLDEARNMLEEIRRLSPNRPEQGPDVSH